MSRTGSGLRLGTRDSTLALWQAGWTRSALERHVPGLEVEIVPVKTTGDRILDIPLSKIGGKGLFTKELDEALLDGRIDAAVHSLKDLPYDLPSGVALAAIGEREDPRDALVSDGRSLNEMPTGARIGTSSLRRQAQLRSRFPALDVAHLRGNLDTRLRKLDQQEFDGIILAAAGLRRLGRGDRITELLDPEWMIPAIGQGALAFVSRRGDSATQDALGRLDHEETRSAVTCERGFMAAVGGSCQVPVAGHAVVRGAQLRLTGLIASIDGAQVFAAVETGRIEDALEIGARLGARLLEAGASAVLEEIQSRNA